MQRSLLLLFLLITNTIVAQPNTDVFIFDLNTSKGKFELSNFKNISNNQGYDNQPSFIDNNTILFAGTRNGQTDIVKYNIQYDSKIFINHTEGSEYSPLKIPNQKAVSAIRLEKNGDQKLHKYNLRNGESEILIEDIVIGYHTWFSPNLLVSSVLEDNKLALYSSKVSTLLHTKLHDNIGRSLHKIPNSRNISFIDKTNSEVWEIHSINPITEERSSIVATLPKSEDMCWLPDGTILMGHENKLYTYKPGKDVDWKEVASLEANKIKNITRLAISPDGKKLAIVAESTQTSNTEETTTQNQTNSSESAVVNPGEIVQKHIQPYNDGDLDAFANAFSENVVVSKYPNDIMYKTRKTLKENYKRSFENNKNLSVKVDKRMVYKNYVIDEEIASFNYAINRHATIYTTSDQGIETMTFVENKKTTSNPEIIVNKQLEAYNKRDIDAFMATYTNDIKLYRYPNKLTSEGQADMRKTYKSWFDATPDLSAKIEQRIVIGNKVIDKEEVRANGKTFSAIAIYEVQNGKIAKVTFIQ